MAAPFKPELDALVEAVDRGWSAAGRAPAALEAVAVPALAASPLAERLSVDLLCAHVARDAALAPQLDPASTFGEPPVTLAVADGFHVDAYLWVAPTTVVHDHGFSGAFQVVEGVSLHTTWRFDSDDPPDAAVRSGALAVAWPEVLHPGEVRGIAAGAGFVHQVAHLTRPSLSLVVRTTSARQVPVTYEYLAPGLALATPHFLDPVHRRRLEIAGWVLRLGRPHALDDLRALVRADDPLLAAWTLRVVARHALEPDLARRLARESPHPFAAPLVEALAGVANAGAAEGLTLVDDEPSRLRWVAALDGLDAATTEGLVRLLRAPPAPPAR